MVIKYLIWPKLQLSRIWIPGNSCYDFGILSSKVMGNNRLGTQFVGACSGHVQ